MQKCNYTPRLDCMIGEKHVMARDSACPRKKHTLRLERLCGQGKQNEGFHLSSSQVWYRSTGCGHRRGV